MPRWVQQSAHWPMLWTQWLHLPKFKITMHVEPENFSKTFSRITHSHTLLSILLPPTTLLLLHFHPIFKHCYHVQKSPSTLLIIQLVAQKAGIKYQMVVLALIVYIAEIFILIFALTEQILLFLTQLAASRKITEESSILLPSAHEARHHHYASSIPSLITASECNDDSYDESASSDHASVPESMLLMCSISGYDGYPGEYHTTNLGPGAAENFDQIFAWLAVAANPPTKRKHSTSPFAHCNCHHCTGGGGGPLGSGPPSGFLPLSLIDQIDVTTSEEEDDVMHGNFELTEWIGTGKVWLENLPRGVKQAQNTACSVPPNIFLAVIPTGKLTVSELLAHDLLKPLTDVWPATFTNDAVSTQPSFETLVISLPFLTGLCSSFNYVWLSGATSICLPHLPHLCFPLWTKKLLSCTQLFLSKRCRWQQACEWMDSAKAAVPADLLSACEDILQILPWDATVPGLSAAVHITTQDLVLFLSSEWLNDEMINAGVDYILRQLGPGSRIQVLNYLFIQSLVNAKARSQLYAPPRLSAIEKSIRNGSALIIYLPLHINGNHWTLLKADMCTKTIYVADSLSGLPPADKLDLVRWWLSSILPDAPYFTFVSPNFPSPRQQDSHSCGIIMLSILGDLVPGAHPSPSHGMAVPYNNAIPEQDDGCCLEDVDFLLDSDSGFPMEVDPCNPIPVQTPSLSDRHPSQPKSRILVGRAEAFNASAKQTGFRAHESRLGTFQAKILQDDPKVEFKDDDVHCCDLPRTHNRPQGGAPSRSQIVMDLFSSAWKDLNAKQHCMVLQGKCCCKPGSLLVVLDQFSCVLASQMFKQLLVKTRSLARNVRLFKNSVPSELPSTGQYLKKIHEHNGLRELIKLYDGRSPFLKCAKGCADGSYDSNTLTGMIQPLVLKQMHPKWEVIEEHAVPPEFNKFCDLLASTSPRAYATFQKTFGGRGTHSMRQVWAKLPRFAQDIAAVNVRRVVDILVKLEYAGPLGLSCDDMALKPAISVCQETKNTCLILSSIDGDIRVTKDNNIDALLKAARLKKADKLCIWLLSIPLPKILPILITAIACGLSVTAADLAAMHKKLLDILHEHGIHPVLLSSDDAKVERVVQQIVANTAMSHLLYDTVGLWPLSLIPTQDSKHVLKTAHNQIFTGLIAINPVSPLYMCNVVKVDKQDDCAAARMTLEFQLKHYPGHTGLSVYLFIFSELIDIWQNRNISHRDHAKIVLCTHLFLWTFGNPSPDAKANQVSTGYHPTYFKADDLDTAILMQYPSDDNLVKASEYGLAEAVQLLKLVGIDGAAMLRDYQPPPSTQSWLPQTLFELLTLYESVPLRSLKDERTFESCEMALAAESLDKSLVISLNFKEEGPSLRETLIKTLAALVPAVDTVSKTTGVDRYVHHARIFGGAGRPPNTPAQNKATVKGVVASPTGAPEVILAEVEGHPHVLVTLCDVAVAGFQQSSSSKISLHSSVQELERMVKSKTTIDNPHGSMEDPNNTDEKE
ncbi:hypothetical protein B0H10DRAFT_1969601 [Mycena sp. CBHHK59/15]|nr:hypothetical protein B0H10DRAFT_1969601 [Mycena sp. CBHHK59/15]